MVGVSMPASAASGPLTNPSAVAVYQSGNANASSVAMMRSSPLPAAWLKHWRRIHTCYDRCAHTFMSAICIAATVIFWLNQ